MSLIVALLSSAAACTKSTKDMVDKQQDIVDNTPLPSDEDPASQPPPAQAVIQQPVATAIRCQLTLLPGLVSVTREGKYPVGLELGVADSCAGTVISGEQRNDVNQSVVFDKAGIAAQISMHLVPAQQVNAQNHSTYSVQFYAVNGNESVPMDKLQTHPLDLKTSSARISSRVINGGNEKYLLICQARSACDQ